MKLRKFPRFIHIIICLCLILSSASSFIPAARAEATLTASESCIDFIKTMEGFSAKPYYDYRQHTVGYGTKCPDDKYFEYMANGISKSEAETLLRETVAEIGSTIHEKLISKYGLTLSQHQFDALVSFSFNSGTAWMTYDSTLRNALLNDADTNELVYAFSLYSTAGGQYLSALIARRLCEAEIFLNGVYSKNVSDAYGYVFYEPNGGSLTYRVQGFVCGNDAKPAANAVRNGDVFVGWYTDLSGGSHAEVLDRSLSGKTLFARWQSAESAETENATSTVVKVTGDVVNIRKGPGTNYGIAKQVYQNDVLVVSHVTQLTSMTWGKVQDGWICLDYTNYSDVVNGTDQTDTETDSDASGEVTAPDDDDTQNDTGAVPEEQPVVSGIVRVNDLLRIRSGPGTTYTTVGYLSNGYAVEILEQKTTASMTWGRIARGWVSMDYITTDLPAQEDPAEPDNDRIPETEPERIPETEPEEDAADVPVQETEPEQDDTEISDPIGSTAIKGKIKADALRIRAAAGTDNRIVGFYYQNDTVMITKRILVDSVCWGKTDKGWINMDYVVVGSADIEDEQPADGKVMTVIADCLRVRKGIGTDNRISALLYYGDTVVVYETETFDGTLWGKVDKGWICMDYVS